MNDPLTVRPLHWLSARIDRVVGVSDDDFPYPRALGDLTILPRSATAEDEEIDEDVFLAKDALEVLRGALMVLAGAVGGLGLLASCLASTQGHDVLVLALAPLFAPLIAAILVAAATGFVEWSRRTLLLRECRAAWSLLVAALPVGLATAVLLGIWAW